MGAIVAVIGEPGDRELSERLERMLARSPYRGTPETRIERGVALGVQVCGEDGSLGEHGQIVVAFNGWVGNWSELAAGAGLDLGDARTDAERLAHAFEVLGEKVFARLRGEFAAVVVDRRSGAAVAARDVYGVRPLFFQRPGDRTYLGSEISQVLAGSGAPPQLDELFMSSALVGRYGAGEETMFAGVRRMVPAHAYSFNAGKLGRAPQSAAYWRPPSEEPALGRNERALVEQLRLVLDRAVGRALATRPGAVALSGGMDSSTIWALARRRARDGDRRTELVGAVSLLFPGFDCDESALVGDIVAVTGGGVVSVDATSAAPFAILEELAACAEGPFGATLYHARLIAEAARTAGHEALYYGFGGDEWLAGSPHYLGDELRRGHLLRVLAHAKGLPLGVGSRRLRNVVRHTIVPVDGVPWRREPSAPAWLHPSRRAYLLQPPPGGRESRAGKILERTLATHHAASYIGNAELVAARAGVELRCPLCDLDVIEFAFRTPGRAFMGGRGEKHLLRLAMAGLLPPSVVWRRGKAEFSAPLRSGAASFARHEDVGPWRLVARNIVVAEQVERMRAELAADEGADTFHDFVSLAIAERLCRRFG